MVYKRQLHCFIIPIIGYQSLTNVKGNVAVYKV